MRNLVIVNQILDPAGMTVNRRAQQLFVNRRDYVINPADLSALEAALQIKDCTGGEVVSLCLGPARVEDVLRQALSMGADRGIRLTDEGVEAADPAVRARILAAAVARLAPFDLVLTGDRVLDSDGGQVGPRVAELLGLAQFVGVDQLTWDNGHLEAIQANGAGFRRLAAEAPLLATFPPEVNSPRHSHAARIMNVYRDPQAVEVWSTGDLGLAAEALAPLTRQGGRGFPPPRELGDRVDGSLDEMAARLAALLS